MREIYNYKKYSVFLPFLGCIARVMLALILVYMPKVILDALEQSGTVEVLAGKIIYWGLVLTLAYVFNLIMHNTIECCSQTILYEHHIRRWEAQAMELDYELFSSPQGKLVMERARNVVSSPNWGVVTYLPRLTNLLENMAGLLTYGVIIGSLHPMILVLLLGVFGVELGVTFFTERKKYSLQEERAGWNRKLNYLAYETRGMQEGKDIRVYGMLPWLRGITRQVIAEKDKVEEKAAKYQFQRSLVTGLLILLRDGVAYWYLIYSFLQQQVSVGDFMLYFGAITGLGNWLTGLVDSVGLFGEARNHMKDFEAFLKLRKETKEYGNSLEWSDTGRQGGENAELNKLSSRKGAVSLTLENVSYYYEQGEEQKEARSVLKKLNLTIPAGERLAIVGINGAGKTTLVKLLCGMLTPKTGRVLVNGKDSRSFSKESYYSFFSAVFQNSRVLPVSIADNVMLNVRKERDEQAFWECLDKSGLTEKVKALPQKEMTRLVKKVAEQGTELSGGELQRLLLARALYKEAPVLILDEPTAALDPLAEREIYEKYHELTKGKTAIFISHRLASTRFCDRIILLEQGQIAETGTHEELMALGGKYAEMFQVQSHYYKEVTCS